MTVDALAVANEFIDLAAKRGDELTPMKLQKLVYFAHGWWLGLTGRPLLGEAIQAWSYGPVVFSVYKAFADYGSNPIGDKATETVVVKPDWSVFTTTTPSLDSLPPDQAERYHEFLDRIYDIYGEYTPIQLTNMTHEPNTPWDKVQKMHEGRIPKYETIPDESIKAYFAAQRKKA